MSFRFGFEHTVCFYCMVWILLVFLFGLLFSFDWGNFLLLCGVSVRGRRDMVPNDGLMVCFKCLRPTQMVFYKVQIGKSYVVIVLILREGLLLNRILCTQSELDQPHIQCKDTIPKIRNKYSQKRNCEASVTISTLMYLWGIYTYIPTIGLPILLQENMWTQNLWEYINQSQTPECGYWDWGHAIYFLGIHKWDFRCSVHTEPDIDYFVFFLDTFFWFRVLLSSLKGGGGGEVPVLPVFDCVFTVWWYDGCRYCFYEVLLMYLFYLRYSLLSTVAKFIVTAWGIVRSYCRTGLPAHSLHGLPVREPYAGVNFIPPVRDFEFSYCTVGLRPMGWHNFHNL
jgi:hypothetical protein